MQSQCPQTSWAALGIGLGMRVSLIQEPITQGLLHRQPASSHLGWRRARGKSGTEVSPLACRSLRVWIHEVYSHRTRAALQGQHLAKTD